MRVKKAKTLKLPSVTCAAEKDGNISEDELRSLTDDVQKLTDKYIAEIDKICDAKEQDILAV